MPKTKKASVEKRRKQQKLLRKQKNTSKEISQVTSGSKKSNPVEQQKKRDWNTRKRLDEQFRKLEREKDATAKRVKYQNDPTEQQKQRNAVAERRQDPLFKSLEQVKYAAARKIKYHSDPAEQQKRRGAVAKRRQDEILKSTEQERNTAAKRGKYQNDPAEQQKQRNAVSQRRKNQALSNSAEQTEIAPEPIEIPETRVINIPFTHTDNAAQRLFRKLIKEGPTQMCTCCLRLWFPRTCHKTNRENWESKYGLELCNKIFNTASSEVMCNSCYHSVVRKKIPHKLCAQNYKIMFDIPPVLKDLTVLEERLVAPRIPFMQIKRLGYDRQCGIKGQIVNVPLSVDTTAKLLPRNINDTHTIQLKLKKRMSHERAYMCETIRPKMVMDALKYLINQPLYQQEGITISENWHTDLNQTGNGVGVRPSPSPLPVSQGYSHLVDVVSISSSPKAAEESQHVQNLTGNVSPENIVLSNVTRIADNYEFTDNFEEALNSIMDELMHDEFEREDRFVDLNPGGEETLLDNTRLENISFAPGENKTPLHLMLDQYAEELSFPTIFGGHKREFTVKVSYGDIAKLQTMFHDRRFAKTVLLLYMAKKLQLIYVVDAVNICLRQNINKNPNKYKASEVLQQECLDQLVKRDLGFRFLRKIVNSPAHWESEKGKLIAMIRQFGVPTVFFTISAAETAWPELLVILSKVVDGKELGELEAINLPMSEKTRLIREDPVTCARYFDNRFHLLLNYMKSEGSPFKENPIDHYYYRVEFQHRGSPHVHGLLWLTNAPVYNKSQPDSIVACAEFVKKYITCDIKASKVQDVIKYQIHHHSKSCKKEVRGIKVCRYGIPFLPMDKVNILEPLPASDEAVLKVAKTKFQEIVKFLNEHREDGMSFSEYLIRIALTQEQYETIIRQNIKTTTIFLQRNVIDCFVNPYNEDILNMQKSNMDIQFILDAYACVSYIVNYINKSERGVSKLLKDAMEDIKKGNLDLKAQLKALGHVFLNASEISAQEATYSLLKLHQSEACTNSKYIDTKPSDQRVRMLRPKLALQQLDPESTDIFAHGLLDHYVQRPDSLETLCLAEFAAFYYFASKDERKNKNNQLPLKDGSGFLFRKKHANIIMWRGYGLQQDEANFYREQLMLYVPWRNEQTEVEDVDQKQLYVAYNEQIRANLRKFTKLDPNVLDEALIQADQYLDNVIETALDDGLDPEHMAFGVDKPDFDPFEFMNDPATEKTEKQTFPTPYQIPDTEFDDIIATLNEQQYEFLNHVMREILGDNRIYNVVCGGAGVGKSRLIKAIHQALLRHFNSRPGNDPNTTKVLLTAPTGKAAFLIGGLTLHSSFVLPVNQSTLDLVPLNADTLNTIHTALVDLKLIIVDEFSMVGARMLHHVDQRLKQIFKSQSEFGGISVVLFGDLKQLPPVGDKWVYAPLKNDVFAPICGTYLWDKFQYFELTEIMRQKEDKTFAIALNRMSVGEMTDDDVRLFKSRQTKGDETLPEMTIHLFKSNDEVDAYNLKKLATYTTERAVSTAKDVVKGACSEQLRQTFLNHAHGLKKSESFGLMYTLTLQVDAKYMVTVNIDTQDGIVNGATGILRKIDYDNAATPFRLWIEFYDASVGKNARRQYDKVIKAKNLANSWTPILQTARAVKVKKGSTIHVERRQFPVTAAEGITIHKSQGATYQHVAVHVAQKMNRSSLYVACSRATSIQGLYIFGDFKAPSKPHATDPTFAELRNLKENKALITTRAKQYLDGKDKVTLAYQNVQSFNKNQKFAVNNPIFKNAGILVFVETWVRDTDSTDIEHFTCFGKICNTLIRKPYGILCYRKSEMSDIRLAKEYTKEINSTVFQAILFDINNDVDVIAVYVPPKFNLSDSVDVLEDIFRDVKREKCMVIGDVNCDLLAAGNNLLLDYLKNRGFAPALQPNVSTTKGNTHIDWCLSNFPTLTANTYETVYSHHKAVAVNIYKDYVPRPSIGEVDSPVTNNNNLIYNIESNERVDLASPERNFSSSSSDISIITIDDESQSSVRNFVNPKLTNNDHVSCYANSSMQCLLSLQEFRDSISKNDTRINKCLYKILNRATTNVVELRQCVGNLFVQQQQQDTVEFLLALFNCLDPDFKYYVCFQQHPNVKYCGTCLIEELGEATYQTILTLYFPEGSYESIDFDRMSETRISDIECTNCPQSYIRTNFRLTEVHKYLIVTLQRTKLIANRIEKIKTTFSNFNNERVVIQNFVFKVVCVILHYGETVTSGHYVAITRQRNGKWLYCNDSTLTEQTHFDDTLKDVYVLLLEKIH